MPDLMKDIFQNVAGQLKETTGIKTRWYDTVRNGHDGKVDFLFKDKKETFFVETKKELRNHHIPALIEQARHHKPLLLIAYKIFPAIKEELRKNNIAYIDGAGNVYLKTDRHFVWIDGQKEYPVTAEPVNRAFTKTGLKVIFQFLIQEDFINATYRQIAEKADVALGNINYVIQGLRDQGFVKNRDKEHLMIVNKPELIERWVTAYAERLRPALNLGTFRFLQPDTGLNWKEIVFKKKDTLWGGEPAGDVLTHFLQPQNWIIYTAEQKNDLIKNYRLVPDPEGNVQAFRRFWTTPAGETEKMGVVHPLLVYADLINTGDPRNIEVAQRIYKQYIENVTLSGAEG